LVQSLGALVGFVFLTCSPRQLSALPLRLLLVPEALPALQLMLFWLETQGALVLLVALALAPMSLLGVALLEGVALTTLRESQLFWAGVAAAALFSSIRPTPGLLLELP